MTETGYPNCPSKIKLEAFFLGERPELSGHVQDCSRCRDLLGSLAQERQEFLQKRPFEDFWREVGTKRRPFPAARFWDWLMPFGPMKTMLAMAGIAGIMIFAVWQQGLPPRLTTKGGSGLGFYISKEGPSTGVEKGKDGMSLPAGTALQFVYSATDEKYLLLLGVEADGTTSIYFPSSAIKPGVNQVLSQALSWQPKSSLERFYGIFSMAPVDVAEVREAVEKVLREGKSIEATSKLPLTYPQASIVLHRK